jgi:predicted nucleotidyltransferase
MQHMLQKRNDLEIIEILRKKPTHIRAISKKIKLIPSTVFRTLNALEKEKVVDFNREGKNKIYFLKETVEAETYLFITEHYKYLKIMQNMHLRRKIVELKKLFKNELIVLFGSYAKGLETKYSDIDIYVETDKKISQIPENIQLKIGKLDKNSALTKEIIKDHIIIQGVDRFYQVSR